MPEDSVTFTHSLNEEIDRRAEERWRRSPERWITRIFLLVAMVVLVVFGIILQHFGDRINDLQDDQDTFAKTQEHSFSVRSQFQAEQNFMHCSREGITDPAKLSDVDKICKNYETLDGSYAYEAHR